MTRDLIFITDADYLSWLEELAGEREVFYPRRLDGDWKYERWGEESSGRIEVSDYRAVESPKNFLFPGRIRAAGFPLAPGGERAGEGKRALIGLKACDLACLPVLDYIFREVAPPDPFYSAAREETVLISQDCPTFKEVCFCPIVGGRPYPLSGFDLNLSPGRDGYLVETGSGRGRELVEEFSGFFQPATPGRVEDRDRRRAQVLAGLKDQLREQGQIEEAPAAEEVAARAEADLWPEESIPCVECGACNLVCPTCHCFILEEATAAPGSMKLRNWDSCQYPGFAREAGGANPRPRRSRRLSNRFSKKFEFFPRVADVIACTGCGRCFEACMGKIDIRKILRRIKSSRG